MQRILFVLALVAVSWAQTDEVYCNYTATGDETLENAVPLSTFRTSGSDFVRAQWCITHCKDRKSIKAEMLFQPANASSAVYKRKQWRTADRVLHVELTHLKGDVVPIKADSDNTFCVDPTVAATVDAVFDKYDDIETISEALNYYINKPGWAYLVYLMGPPPSIIASVNVHQDVNFCMKTVVKNYQGQFQEFQVFSGLVQPAH